jgi:hypothetical protein
LRAGDHDLHADARDDLAAPAGARPVLRHADPAGVRAVLLGSAVLPFGEARQDLKVLQAVMRPEVEPQLDAAIFVRMDFFAFRASEKGDLCAVYVRSWRGVVRGERDSAWDGDERVVVFRVPRIGLIVPVAGGVDVPVRRWHSSHWISATLRQLCFQC